MRKETKRIIFGVLLTQMIAEAVVVVGIVCVIAWAVVSCDRDNKARWEEESTRLKLCVEDTAMPETIPLNADWQLTRAFSTEYDVELARGEMVVLNHSAISIGFSRRWLLPVRLDGTSLSGEPGAESSYYEQCNIAWGEADSPLLRLYDSPEYRLFNTQGELVRQVRKENYTFPAMPDVSAFAERAILQDVSRGLVLCDKDWYLGWYKTDGTPVFVSDVKRKGDARTDASGARFMGEDGREHHMYPIQENGCFVAAVQGGYQVFDAQGKALSAEIFSEAPSWCGADFYCLKRDNTPRLFDFSTGDYVVLPDEVKIAGAFPEVLALCKPSADSNAGKVTTVYHLEPVG